MSGEQLLTTDEALGETLIEYPNIAKHIKGALIAFAKMHVAAALKAAIEKATVDIEYGHGDWMLSMTVEKYEVNKESILTAYPLDNIK